MNPIRFGLSSAIPNTNSLEATPRVAIATSANTAFPVANPLRANTTRATTPAISPANPDYGLSQEALLSPPRSTTQVSVATDAQSTVSSVNYKKNLKKIENKTHRTSEYFSKVYWLINGVNYKYSLPDLNIPKTWITVLKDQTFNQTHLDDALRSPKKFDDFGTTLLGYAAYLGKTELVTKILQNSEYTQPQMQYFNTGINPLKCAIAGNNLDCFNIIWEQMPFEFKDKIEILNSGEGSLTNVTLLDWSYSTFPNKSAAMFFDKIVELNHQNPDTMPRFVNLINDGWNKHLTQNCNRNSILTIFGVILLKYPNDMYLKETLGNILEPKANTSYPPTVQHIQQGNLILTQQATAVALKAATRLPVAASTSQPYSKYDRVTNDLINYWKQNPRAFAGFVEAFKSSQGSVLKELIHTQPHLIMI